MTIITTAVFAELNEYQRTGNQQAPTYGVNGLSDRELIAIERELGFDLPPDLRVLLANVQDPGGVLFPWADFSMAAYRASIERIRAGIHFDIEHNSTWLARWGERPVALADAKAVADADFESWPRLAPVYGHRYLPVDPCREANPVFSIWQTDIIYYGANLADYLRREFVCGHEGQPFPELTRRIPIWSDFVERPEGFIA